MIFGHHHHNLNARVPGPVKQPPSMLTLKPIGWKKFREGGYDIEFTGAVPQGCTVRLVLGNSARLSMDITGGYQRHWYSHFKQLLELMDEGDLWGKKVPVRVVMYSGGKMLQETLSVPQFIQCPLEPIRELGVEEIGGVEGLRYTGSHSGRGGGTFLSNPVNGKYYFIYDHMLRYDAQSWGFDCTTYVGSALGLQNGQGQGGTGETLANALKAQSCGMELKHSDAIVRFFGEHKTGSYIMWYSEGTGTNEKGHVVVVKNGIVHEFTKRDDVDGHDSNAVSEWFGIGGHKHHRWTVRKLAS